MQKIAHVNSHFITYNAYKPILLTTKIQQEVNYLNTDLDEYKYYASGRELSMTRGFNCQHRCTYIHIDVLCTE